MGSEMCIRDRKYVSRGDTTVVDAYLSPMLRNYVSQVADELGDVRLMFMQSNGGLTDASLFRGKDAILSGPAGGIVGAVKTAAGAGCDRIISFDMGGTSTDVAHYNGEYERTFETLVAGVRMRAPMMRFIQSPQEVAQYVFLMGPDIEWDQNQRVLIQVQFVTGEAVL